MKKRVLFFISLFLFNATEVEAQADLNIFGDVRPIGMEEQGMSFTVRNNGTANSQPFKIKVWVSVDSVIDDTDLNSTSTELGGLRPYNSLLGITDEKIHSVGFNFPLPMESPTLPLLGRPDIRPADWLGREVYVKGCIAVDLVNFNDCEEFSRFVAPPRPKFTVSSGVSRDFIEVKWPPIKPDDARPMVDMYRVVEVVPNGFPKISSRLPNSFPIVVDSDQIERHRFEINPLFPGKRYSYQIESCHTGPTAMICAAVELLDGNSLADYSAQTSPRGIKIDWEEFAPRWSDYELERCLAGQTTGCTRIRRKSSDTTYVDLDVERAKFYVYTVFACSSDDSGLPAFASGGNESLCANKRFRQGMTNLGTPGLVDEYEEDDNPAQAKQVRSTVSQLRSFDTNDDQDWVEIILSKPQAITIVTSGDTNNDTELILYQADAATMIEGDSGGQVGLYARLKTDVLPASRYYLQVFQKDPGLDALYKPVANYRLDIEITEGLVILAPIIDLILGDD